MLLTLILAAAPATPTVRAEVRVLVTILRGVEVRAPVTGEPITASRSRPCDAPAPPGCRVIVRDMP